MNGSDIPKGNIIHLTKEDFNIFPKLAVIRDNISFDGSNLYFLELTSDEYYFFKECYMSPNRTPHLGDNRFFEYEKNIVVLCPHKYINTSKLENLSSQGFEHLRSTMAETFIEK